MIEIIPAIIPKKFGDLEEKMSLVSGLVPLVQVDVMDGRFVPEKSWPYAKMADPDFAAILKQEREFPFLGELDFEVDLMVLNPERVWEDWFIVGASRIIFHFESTADPLSFINLMKQKMTSRESLIYTEIGVAFGVETPNEKIYPLLPVVDFVQFMGIAKIGFQGEPFDERVIKKIADLRATHSNATISVDGGVHKESAVKLAAAGANRLVIGSAIFESEDVAQSLEEFQTIAIQ